MQHSEKVSNKFCCVVCNKQYTKKASLDKHKILCDFKIKTKREHQVEIEELSDIPDNIQLVKIVQELSLKLVKMEEKMEQIQKWVNRKKRKLNVLTWLNTNSIPTVGFLEWVQMYLTVKPEHFENLMENTIFNTIQQVFEDNLSDKPDFIYPISCFSQKTGIFYIYDKKEDETDTNEWRQLVLNDMLSLLKTIQKRIINELTKWKMANQHKFDDNAKVSILFNKAVIKLMNISFIQDSNLSRIKNGLYNYLKTDLKSVVEFDFDV